MQFVTETNATNGTLHWNAPAVVPPDAVGFLVCNLNGYPPVMYATVPVRGSAAVPVPVPVQQLVPPPHTTPQHARRRWRAQRTRWS